MDYYAVNSGPIYFLLSQVTLERSHSSGEDVILQWTPCWFKFLPRDETNKHAKAWITGRAVLAETDKIENVPDSKVRVANMGPTWILSAPGGPHVGPMNLVIMDISIY